MNASALPVADDDASDRQLIDAVGAGGRGRFGTLYERHRDAAWRVARRYADGAAQADDLVAESFANLLAAVRRGAGPRDNVRAYLLTIVTHEAARAAHSVRGQYSTEAVELAEVPQVFEDPVLKSFDAETIRRAFMTLPERSRALLWYAAVEDLKPAAIGRLLGLSPNATSVALKRARERLADAYLQGHVRSVQDRQCCAVGPSLAAYAAGRLRGPSLASTRFHVENCLNCSAAVLHLRDVNRGLRAAYLPLAAALPVGGGLLTALGIGAATEPSARAGRWGWGLFGVPGGTAGTAGVTSAVVVVGVVAGIGAARLVTAEPAPAETLTSAAQPLLGAGAPGSNAGDILGGPGEPGLPGRGTVAPSGSAAEGAGAEGSGAAGAVPGAGVRAPGTEGKGDLGHPGGGAAYPGAPDGGSSGSDALPSDPRAGMVPGFPGFPGAGTVGPPPAASGAPNPGGSIPGTVPPSAVPITRPPSSRPPSSQPPSSQPPSSQPPSSVPPITVPPTTRPPSSAPPITVPPTVTAPVTTPPTGSALGVSLELADGRFWQHGLIDRVATARIAVSAPVATVDRRLTLQFHGHAGWLVTRLPGSATWRTNAPTGDARAAGPGTLTPAQARALVDARAEVGAGDVTTTVSIELPAGTGAATVHLVAVHHRPASSPTTVPAIPWTLTDPIRGDIARGVLPAAEPTATSAPSSSGPLPASPPASGGPSATPTFTSLLLGRD